LGKTQLAYKMLYLTPLEEELTNAEVRKWLIIPISNL